MKPVLVGWSYGIRIVCDYLTRYSDTHFSGINFVGSAVSSDPKIRGPVLGFSGGIVSDDIAQILKATREFNRSCFYNPPSEADLDQLTAISMVVPGRIRQWMGRPASYVSARQASLCLSLKK